MDYKEKLQNVDFRNSSNFLTEKTLEFGNKTVITSAIITLLSLNFLNIDSLEVGGVSLTIKAGILTFILLCVNIYFFLQFSHSREIDDLSFQLSTDIEEVMNSLDETKLPELEELRLLIEDVNATAEAIKSPNLSDLVRDEMKLQMHIKASKIEVLKKKLNESAQALTNDIIQIKLFRKSIQKYNTLNSSIPKIAYYTSLISVVFRFVILVITFCSSERPWIEFFDEDLQIIMSIFKTKDS